MIMNKTIFKRMLSPFIKLKYHIKSKGVVYIGNNVKIKNIKNINICNNVNICSNSVLICGGRLILKDKAYIGYFSEIMCIHNVEIGQNVICGPYMFITDSNHEYRDVNRPISEQGAPIAEQNNRIIIENDCWIGAHVCIIGNVKIGKHSIIAAGAVVTRDVPSYCLVGGVPAHILKHYNFDLKMWIDEH